MLPADDPEAVRSALAVLERGGLVIFPTDTVYGVGAQAYNEDAIRKLFVVKEREFAKPIPLLIANMAAFPKVTRNLSQTAQRLANKFWPGPLTLIVERATDIPDILTRDDSVGVRAPDHPFITELLAQAGPLAVTSANLSGQPSVCDPSDLSVEFSQRVDLTIDAGRTPGGRASTVVDCTVEPIRLLRDGPIRFEELLEAVK